MGGGVCMKQEKLGGEVEGVNNIVNNNLIVDRQT